MMIIVYILLAIIALIVLYFLFLAICAALVDTHRIYTENSPFYRAILNSATFAALKLTRVRIHVTEKEKVPANVKPVFVSNHRSNFDPIVSWYVFRKWLPAYISKDENFKIPFYGAIIRKCCFMPIDRENPRNALKTIDQAAELIKKDEVSIGIYPEGHRNPKGGLLPFHNGVFKIAQRASAPIVVLTVKARKKYIRISL